MTALADSFLKILLDKLPQQALKTVEAWAPPAIAERVKALMGVAKQPLQAFFIFPQEVLSRLHPSWFEDVVAFCPEALRAIALRAIQEEMGRAEKTFSDQVRGFLLQEVLSKWPEKVITEDIKPELVFLKDCSADELITLADLVSLYELVEDVRKVVEKKKLQRLFERISPIQQKYLKQLLQGKKFHTCYPIELRKFLELDVKKAAEMLRGEGLKKIGIVLKNEDPSVSWLVLHRMDKNSACTVREGKDMEEVPCDLKLLQKKFIHAFQFVQR